MQVQGRRGSVLAVQAVRRNRGGARVPGDGSGSLGVLWCRRGGVPAGLRRERRKSTVLEASQTGEAEARWKDCNDMVDDRELGGGAHRWLHRVSLLQAIPAHYLR